MNARCRVSRLQELTGPPVPRLINRWPMESEKMHIPSAPRRAACIAVLAALVAAAAPCVGEAASPSDPLSELLRKRGNDYLCFRRVYDEAHLKRHRGQVTTAALLSLSASTGDAGQQVWVKLQFRQRPDRKAVETHANVGASCEWSATANRDTSGQRLIATYPREDGFSCLAMYNNTAAEEAGTLMLDLSRDGRTLTVHLHEEGIGLWGTVPEHATADDKAGAGGKVQAPLKPGPEDRVFRLMRADAAECAAMETVIDLQH